MMRILYVEDDAINALVMRKFLDREFDFDIAQDGVDCLNMARERRYDLILMDINLGTDKMDGVETLVHLRTDPAYRSTPVFAVTAFAMPGDRARYLEAGFDDYFAKPVNRQQILERIRQEVA